MPIYKGMSGRIVLGNEQSKINPHNTKVISRYNNNSVCQLPSLINSKDKKNLSLNECALKCKNDANCDYITHTSVKGDPNRECKPSVNDWNKNLSIPTGRPCIPEKGKSNCNVCHLYNVKTMNGSNKKLPIKLVPNKVFTTITKDNIKAIV